MPKTTPAEAEPPAEAPPPDAGPAPSALPDAPDALAAAVALLERHGLAVGPRGAATGPLLVNPRDLPPPAEGPPDPMECFDVKLPPRFGDYVRRRAAAHGEHPERHLATMIRAFWQADPWRAAATATAPSGPGQAAGTARRG